VAVVNKSENYLAVYLKLLKESMPVSMTRSLAEIVSAIWLIEENSEKIIVYQS